MNGPKSQLQPGSNVLLQNVIDINFSLNMIILFIDQIKSDLLNLIYLDYVNITVLFRASSFSVVLVSNLLVKLLSYY